MRKYFGYALAAALFLGVNAHAQAMTKKEAGELLPAASVEIKRNNSKICTAAKIGDKQYLTASHCLAGNLYVQQNWSRVQIRSYMSTIPYSRNKNKADWAVLSTSSSLEDVKTLELACDEEPYLGMPVAYFGYPSVFTQGYFSTGYVSSTSPLDLRSGSDAWTDLGAAGGASGSAVVSLDSGKIIGILVEGVNDSTQSTGIQSIKDVCETLYPAKEDEDEVSDAVLYRNDNVNDYLPSPF